MKNNQLIFKYFFISAFIFLFSCEHESDLTNLRKVCYENEIRPIFVSNCSMCHNATKHESDVDFSNYQGIIKTLVKGNPEESELYNSISNPYGEFMPPSPANALAKDQRSLIYAWILQNADSTTCE
jgi:uncharacterized membrane protein